MQDFKPRVTHRTVDPQERCRRLAQVYAAILSWPDPHDTQNELAAESLGGETATSSTSETPEEPDALFNSSTKSVQDDKLASGVDPINTNSIHKGAGNKVGVE